MAVGAQFQIFETDNQGIFGGSTAIGTAVAEFPNLDAGNGMFLDLLHLIYPQIFL